MLKEVPLYCKKMSHMNSTCSRGSPLWISVNLVKLKVTQPHNRPNLVAGTLRCCEGGGQQAFKEGFL